MKESYDLILNLPFKGGVVFSASKKIFKEYKIPENIRNSGAIIDAVKKVIPMDFVNNIFVNIGPGNFSSLRVEIISAFGIFKGLGFKENKFKGYSLIDYFAFENFDDKESSVFFIDKRGNGIGSTYDCSFNLINESMRKRKNEIEESSLIIEDFNNYDIKKLKDYLHSKNFINRNPFSPIYFQKSYFEK